MVLLKHFYVNNLPVELCSVFWGKDSCAGLMKLDSDVCMIDKGLGWKTTPFSKLGLGLGSLSKASTRKCWSLLWNICGFRSWKAGNWLLLGCRDVWEKGLNVCDCLLLRAAFWNLERSPWPSTEVAMINNAISSITVLISSARERHWATVKSYCWFASFLWCFLFSWFMSCFAVHVL